MSSGMYTRRGKCVNIFSETIKGVQHGTEVWMRKR